jgi:predicted nucleotidyltransferase component of viral defense system
VRFINPMQFKSFIKKTAAEKHILAQLVMQNYLMERLLERIALSNYNNNFILKGGFLIAALVGLDSRATMDLDLTAKGINLSHENISEIFKEICSTKVHDDIAFSLIRISDIRENDDYPGVRVRLEANYLTLKVPIIIDVTTGDRITPKEIDYSYKLLFDERTISILAYNLETILAEKLETVLARNVVNTRPRDFYDIYILYALRGKECNVKILKRALQETTKKRNSSIILSDYHEILNAISKNKRLKEFWGKYQKEFEYAKDISYEDTCNMVMKIMSDVMGENGNK